MNINVKNAIRKRFHSRINEHISKRQPSGLLVGIKLVSDVGRKAKTQWEEEQQEEEATRGSCCQGGGGRGQAVWSLHFPLPLEGPPPAASLSSSQLTSCFSCGSASSSPKRADWSGFNVGMTPKSEMPQNEINE